MVTLRPYQAEAVAAIGAEYSSGRRSTLLVLPTGCGKTVVFAELARRSVDAGGRVLVLAHRTELLTQAQAKLRAVGVWAELEKAQRRAGLASVVVASVQTLRAERLESFSPDAFTDIVVDEAHHAAAKGYRAILDRFASARVLGVTATPDRLDGAALGDVFESCAYRYELKQAIADGYLAPLRARRVDVDAVDLSAVHTRAGDLAQNELAEIMAAEEALHGVAVPLLEQAGDRRAIVFAVDVAHAHKLAEVINRYDSGAARAVDGTASEDERSGVLEAFRQGAFRILVNCALFTEGFDEPSISCVAIARPTKSRALYTQMVGRGTRLCDGKRDCLVLDFSGNSGRHRLVGPVDVLAGREVDDDEVRAEVQRRMADEQLELDGVLEAAEAEVQRRRSERKFTATARYVASEIDPFIGGADNLEDEIVGIRERVGRQGEPATRTQLEMLDRKGLSNMPPELSYAEAQAILRKLHQRQELGLCTLKQARLLVKLGVSPDEAREMPFAAASRRLDDLLSQRKTRRTAAVGGSW